MRKLSDYIRGFNYFFNYYLREKPLGLDFSMRDLSEIKDARQNGYAMTSDEALSNIAKKVDFNGKLLLDIGSGKGRVIFQSVRLGANKAEGIEFSEKFHLIASSNFRILGVTEKCKSNLYDATEFKRYNEFDIFFLFNPFNDDLYEQVIDIMMEQCEFRTNQRFIICYGGANLASITKYKSVNKIYEGLCPHRGNRLNIFSF